VGGVCTPGFTIVDFAAAFAANQPTGWRAGQGSSTVGFPIVPAVPEDPFVGVLRCFTTDPTSIAVGNNALVGEATIERFTAGTLPNIAKYNAVGIPATTTGNGDPTLTFGGPDGEYSGCPNLVVLNNFFDGAADPVLSGASIATTLALTPCSANYQTQQPASVNVQYLIFNEFEVQFSTAGVVSGQQVTSLASIGPPLTVGITGTLTGQVQVRGTNGGILGIGLEAHQNGTVVESTGLNTHFVGERFAPDTVTVP
jgi:hypothetical protein